MLLLWRASCFFVCVLAGLLAQLRGAALLSCALPACHPLCSTMVAGCQVVTILFMNVLVGVILSPFRAMLKSKDTSSVDVKEALIRKPGAPPACLVMRAFCSASRSCFCSAALMLGLSGRAQAKPRSQSATLTVATTTGTARSRIRWQRRAQSCCDACRCTKNAHGFDTILAGATSILTTFLTTETEVSINDNNTDRQHTQNCSTTEVIE